MKATEAPIEGEFAEHDLAVIPPKEIALSTQDPTEFLERAVKQADALKKVIDAKGLAIYIGGGKKAHVLIDGWQTLMALNGVMPYTVSCVKERDGDGKLTAHVVTEIRRVGDGTVLTRVETECSQHESRWARADDYAVISMAQTRGVGKGCRQLFGWVMTLAGFAATPAEEMPETTSSVAVGAAPSAGSGDVPAPAPRKSTGYVETGPVQTDASGPMSAEQIASIQTLRQDAKRGEETQEAQARLKAWGYKTWASFIVRGTALQAAEIEEILRSGDK